MNASRVSEAEEAALSRETQAKEQLSLALEKAQEEARIQQEALANQVKPQRTDHSLLCELSVLLQSHVVVLRCCSRKTEAFGVKFTPNLAVC